MDGKGTWGMTVHVGEAGNSSSCNASCGWTKDRGRNRRKKYGVENMLNHSDIRPVSLVQVKEDKAAFQNCKIVKRSEVTFPLILEKDEVILDFGDHYTGYLHIALDGASEHRIPDSPTNLLFSFAEMPIELVRPLEDNPKALSVGWAQVDFKTIAFMPYAGNLERRYSFRYLKLKRTDSVRFAVKITDLYIDAVSAVRMEDVRPCHAEDALLREIDHMCVKTLKECEQEVYEDGPKRDRRLWVGDLRLQALVDYKTFANLALTERCISLFAGHLNQKGLVAPCVFPNTKPYVDQWLYLDYSLCFVLCLNDYLKHTGKRELPEKFYDIAARQIAYADSVFHRETGDIQESFFIDHGKYDRSTAALGYFAYTLHSMIELSEKLGKPNEAYHELLQTVTGKLLERQDKTTGLFLDNNKQISWQSQIWAVLSGALTQDAAQRLMEQTEKVNPEIRISSPFMMHYYLEALFCCGKAEAAFSQIKSYWGAMKKAGFDCCPECFDPENEWLTPYGNPSLNSACHAWSCTPSYWIRAYDEKAKKCV